MPRQLINLLWGALTGALGGLLGAFLVAQVGLAWALLISVLIAGMGLVALPPLLARFVSPEALAEVIGLAAAAFFFGIPGVLLAHWFGTAVAVIGGAILGMVPVLAGIGFLKRRRMKDEG